MTSYHVLTRYGALIRTFADKADAIAFARAHIANGAFPGCTVALHEVVERTITVWRERPALKLVGAPA